MEKRDSDRQQTYTLMPARMLIKATGAVFPCRIDDVSSDGLGILARVELEPGVDVVFETMSGKYSFVVAWCREAERREYRCGLRLTDEGVNLETVFAGLIAAKSAGF